jgi:hypothetical protein
MPLGDRPWAERAAVEQADEEDGHVNLRFSHIAFDTGPSGVGPIDKRDLIRSWKVANVVHAEIAVKGD